ncbi:MAG TPA: hypothetical protein VNN73_21905 [Blastocatellia bacterium]|nr:hypothetical protein [Blastocatellia bacterium]
MEMELKNISEEDQILIRTQNSEYRFSVTDPEERRGLLSGGSLGDRQRDAVLVGMLGITDGLKSDISSLKTGGRALFYLKSNYGVERLITSVITGIARKQASGNEKRAA